MQENINSSSNEQNTVVEETPNCHSFVSKGEVVSITLYPNNGDVVSLPFNQLLRVVLQYVSDNEDGAYGDQRITMKFPAEIIIIEGDRLSEIFHTIKNHRTVWVQAINQRYRKANQGNPWVGKITSEDIE